MLQNSGGGHNLFKQPCPIAKGAQWDTVFFLNAPASLESNDMYDIVPISINFHLAWDIIDDDDKVMSHLMLWNKLYSHQSWDTPCAKEPIKDYIGQHRIIQGAKDIIE
eukprot:1865939-Ditylum_brightwellii.AAC.1